MVQCVRFEGICYQKNLQKFSIILIIRFSLVYIHLKIRKIVFYCLRIHLLYLQRERVLSLFCIIIDATAFLGKVDLTFFFTTTLTNSILIPKLNQPNQQRQPIRGRVLWLLPVPQWDSKYYKSAMLHHYVSNTVFCGHAPTHLEGKQSCLFVCLFLKYVL